MSEAVIRQETQRRISQGELTQITLQELDPTLRARLESRGYNAAEIIEQINERLRLESARTKIAANWKDQGGPASQLGLPLDDTFPIQKIGGGYSTPFRGGHIQINGDLNTLESNLAPTCRLTFQGLILHSRQETSPDEIYGAGGYRIGSILVGDKVLTGNFIIPEVKLGGKDAINTRVSQVSQEIYRGPPVGLELFVGIREHDSGDRQEVRNKVKTIMEEGAKNVAAALGAADGNVAQVGMAGEKIAKDVFGDFLKDAAAEFITEFFGLSDDPYNAGGVSITPEEMASPPPVSIAGHQLDNKTIEYTHKVDMSGIDDSGAVGNCSAYFRLWR